MENNGQNGWKEIWNSKKWDVENIDFEKGNQEHVFMMLKAAMGIQPLGANSAITFMDFYQQFMKNYKELVYSSDDKYAPASFFDVGCGTGGYLYLLKKMNDSYEIGGCDYGDSFIRMANKVLGSTKELYCAEAMQLDSEIKYDCVFARSIFQYFPNSEYAKEVTRKMLNKARHSIGIFDVHDLNKKKAYIDYRKSVVENYTEKYAGIEHLFLEKSLFLAIADEFGYAVKFSKASLSNYWNDPYTYDVYIYKEF